MKRSPLHALVALGLIATACVPAAGGTSPIEVGALYPLSGSQGPGGQDELHGVQLAADYVNADGGIAGRKIALDRIDVPGSDAVPDAIDQLARKDVRFVVGSYGSTISRPAAMLASRRGMLFWETGAVGEMLPQPAGKLAFRVAPTGAALGKEAIDFVANVLAPKLGLASGSLRVAIAEVDDVYGREVGDGAAAEVRALGLPDAGVVLYDPHHLDAPAIVHRIADLHPNVLFVSAYLDDGIALRRETVSEKLPLAVNIGTSSSYCLPGFGQALGADAVGTFASDKPNSAFLKASGLAPDAQRLLTRAAADYRARYGADMSAAALSGFSSAWALFRDVMPEAATIAPDAVAAAALRMDLPTGSLPNGSGLRFAPPGAPDAGSNVAATSVIWEWVAPGRRAVVWPPRFAPAQVDATVVHG
ncbi:MAG: ABC transporter substrate-binding protein [Chloroflexota bacterium]|nr:ABC transporter substrate-binding protein [Chloroflexota bacterium]MDE3193748.1 ABC transporter substrate-binding protein [Chloroflexota bacterium]